jgi:thioester reductase-like protein
MPSISRIYALVRAPDVFAAANRVDASLAARGLVLTSEELAKIVSVPSDLSRSDLGLGSLYDDLLTSLTHVIHCAWAVNFNIPVQAFVSQHIQGLHNLLSLCLASHLPQPASLVFCSSLSVAGATPQPDRVGETVVEDLSHAQNMGYARSKLVGEHIVRNAMRITSIRARVARIGQIVGDARTGSWNETEAVPLMVRSARTTGALPMLDEVSNGSR